MKTTRTALAAAAMLSTAYAQFGSFAVINHCPFDLYLWPVAGGEAPGAMITLPGGQPQIGYKETYRTTANNGGVSIKISPNYAPGNSVPAHTITQLEYTVPNRNDPSQASVANLIFYDLSWVDGNPFEGIAMTMQTSMGQSSTPCPSGTCGLGKSCDVGYLWSTDDVKTHACGLDQDIIWTFCSQPGGSLQVPKGLLQSKRDAIPEPVPEAKADSDALAVCVQVGGDGLAQLCDEGPVPTPAPSSTTTSAKPAPPTTTPAPVVALQKPSTPQTSAAAAPVPVAPVPVAPVAAAAPVSLVALTNIQSAGVTTWYSWQNAPHKRDVSSHSHLHNHQAFHRRNRIIKSVAA